VIAIAVMANGVIANEAAQALNSVKIDMICAQTKPAVF